MTAESVEHRVQWPVPPQDGYTVDDLFTLPDLPPHTELIDGSLVFVSPQRYFHFAVIHLLANGLRSTVPPDLKVACEMTVVLDRRNGPEPDISVVRKEAVTGPRQTCFKAADVLLAVEVVSPDSEARDRDYKPHKYAAAGIPHYWLVEMAGQDDHPVVQVYERGEATGTYALTGIFHDQVKVSVPYDIHIDLTAFEQY
ncbi:Uma2 family endonuclease [Streptomyces achromogenes]|uniref:Uma2 family endonuclease n=1 Tax=Streptomyces lavenduligriseus TaxID=67315 RepID=A0ABT0NRF1_9ACTN|nr:MULTISPECIES: Uma2 family endonuclease [Streptomyces]MCL3993970.1 Uma2 family endonuclease [Streptomyces lavenduligriseus]